MNRMVPVPDHATSDWFRVHTRAIIDSMVSRQIVVGIRSNPRRSIWNPKYFAMSYGNQQANFQGQQTVVYGQGQQSQYPCYGGQEQTEWVMVLYFPAWRA